MKTVQDKKPTTLKQRRYGVWFIRFALLLGLPILFYYGYCWGLWGRNSLLLQYLFQCSCPLASNEARYPDDVDVLVPACQYTSSKLSPTGTYLYVYKEKFWHTSAYLLDLQTMERIDATSQPFSSFLTDDLWFAESGLEDDIIDRTNGTQYPVKTFRFWRENAYVNGKPNLELLVSALHQAEHAFFTQKNNDVVVVLMSNFLTLPEQSFTFSRSDIPVGDFNTRVEQFLQENNVNYQTIPEDFPSEAISPNGKLIARNDGIYLIEANQKIVEGHSLSVRGWTYDGRGVIYFPGLSPCLIWTNFGVLDDFVCFFEVPRPVLLLKVPEEYLTSTQTP